MIATIIKIKAETLDQGILIEGYAENFRSTKNLGVI